MNRLPCVLLPALLLCGVHVRADEITPTEADQALLRLLAEDLDAQMRRSPTWASMRGDRRFDDQLGDPSPEAQLDALVDTQRRLAELEDLDPDQLSPRERVSAGLLRHELRGRVEAARFRGWLTPVSQIDGPQQWLPQLPQRLSFDRPEHLEAWVARLEAVPAYLDQTIANMRQGLAEGLTPPRLVMANAAEQALTQARAELVEHPELHPMFAPLAELDPDDPRAARGRRAIADGVIPAFRRLGEFLRDEYVPACRETIAASARPDGAEFYGWRVRHHTTLDLTPEEIHALGLSEVARIRAEMLETIARTDFTPPAGTAADPDAVFAAFVAFLRDDPRFYFTDPQDLLAAYRDVAKRVDAELPGLFGRLPRLPYGVRALPAEIAETAPTAYYYQGSSENGVPGWFMANTSKLDQRPRYEMIPLTLHEAVPGHHLQISLAHELDDLPEWRETLGYTVFVEGWALYAERLGLEMGGGPRGFYADPYDDFGRLSYEMWRAMRLVVDTGIHALGWTRQRAVEFMLSNSALSEDNVASEVDRYITWPGQALAYKLGELRIRALRARAEEALGEDFDLRAFHDALLEEGALPMSVLEAKIERWITEQRR
jgi:uncharacterized protein (DUF885 family)